MFDNKSISLRQSYFQHDDFMSAEVLGQPDDVSPRLKGFFSCVVGVSPCPFTSLPSCPGHRLKKPFSSQVKPLQVPENETIYSCVTSDLADVTPEHQRSCALVSWRLLYTPALHQSQSNLPFPETHSQADEHVLFSEHTLQPP